MENKYIIRSRISEHKFREILKIFCLDIEAKKCSQLCGINRNTASNIYD
ncbi:MAG: IS1595 family transposase, partial [Chitinispirillales bacterium]|nr:IS1595 family transposase [Chitinispirillales bacterium]